MEKVINLRFPHVGEQIFENVNTDDLIQFLEVSTTWSVLAENVLLKRWTGRMFEACKSQKTEIVKILLERCNVEDSGLNTRHKRGWTAFMYACAYGPKDIVQLLLDHAATNIDLTAKQDEGMSALMLACILGNKDSVQLLISNPTIELNARDNPRGWTAFLLACCNGHTEVVEVLLSNPKIEVNVTYSILNYTAFMLACMKGHKNTVQLLLDHSDRNIDFNATEFNGFTAFTLACHHGQKDIIQLLLDYSSKRNIEVNTRNNNQPTNDCI